MHSRGFVAALAAVLALGATGCGTAVSGSAIPDADGPFDLCAALPVETAARHVRADRPVFLSKGIEARQVYPAGMGECRYGTISQTGLTLAFPLGDPVPDIADLATSVYKATSSDITVDGARARLTTAEFESVLAVQHGRSQFALHWHRMSQGDAITPEELQDLAREIMRRVPAGFEIAHRDIPPVCTTLTGAAELTGPVSTAFGSATPERLQCDFVGADGVVHAQAMPSENAHIARLAGLERDRTPHEVVEPPLAPASVTFVEETQFDGFDITGYVEDGGIVTIDFDSTRYDRQRSDDFDVAERAFVTAFIAATRAWRK